MNCPCLHPITWCGEISRKLLIVYIWQTTKTLSVRSYTLLTTHFLLATTLWWFSRFKKIANSISQTHHLFFIHRNIKWRNEYTAKCRRRGKEPVLPGINSKLLSKSMWVKALFLRVQSGTVTDEFFGFCKILYSHFLWSLTWPGPMTINWENT